jgi:hypothetical protein
LLSEELNNFYRNNGRDVILPAAKNQINHSIENCCGA